MRIDITDQLFQKLPLVITIIIFIVAFFIYKNQREFIKNSIITKGVVVEIVDNHRGISTYSTTTIVSFYTKNNEIIYFSPSLRGYHPIYSIGDFVEVIYSKNNPKNADINGFFSLWFSLIIILLIGSFFLFFTLGVAF